MLRFGMPHFRIPLLAPALVAVFALLCACTSGPDIRSDYDRDADFNQYDTFGFFDPLGTDKKGYSTLITAHFKSAAREQMEQLGYTYTDKEPDLLVNFFSNTESRTDVRSSPSVTTYYGYRYGFYLGMPLLGNDTDTVHYKVGTLNIDVVDAADKRLIWEGIAEGRLSDEAMENPRASIHQAVANIFQHYPTRLPHSAR